MRVNLMPKTIRHKFENCVYYINYEKEIALPLAPDNSNISAFLALL